MRADMREGEKGLEREQTKNKRNIMNGRSAVVQVCACIHLCMHTCVYGQTKGIWREIPAAPAARVSPFFYSHTGKVEKLSFFSIVLKSIFFHPPTSLARRIWFNRKFQMREPFNLISYCSPALPILPLIWSPIWTWLLLHMVLLSWNLHFPWALCII